MEPCAKKITRKNNPILVAAVFRLMFETLWIPPYDRRRCNALVADFDLCARSAVTRLAATDLAARLLPPERCAEALESVRRIVAGLRERCADPV